MSSPSSNNKMKQWNDNFNLIANANVVTAETVSRLEVKYVSITHFYDSYSQKKGAAYYLEKLLTAANWNCC